MPEKVNRDGILNVRWLRSGQDFFVIILLLVKLQKASYVCKSYRKGKIIATGTMTSQCGGD
jgi:hypothetical protein